MPRGPPHALPGGETAENACQEGGHGRGPDQLETMEKHWKSKQKRCPRMHRSPSGMPLGLSGPLQSGLRAACRAQPGWGCLPWKTLKTIGNPCLFAICARRERGARVQATEASRDPVEKQENTGNNKYQGNGRFHLESFNCKTMIIKRSLGTMFRDYV